MASDMDLLINTWGCRYAFIKMHDIIHPPRTVDWVLHGTVAPCKPQRRMSCAHSICPVHVRKCSEHLSPHTHTGMRPVGDWAEVHMVLKGLLDLDAEIAKIEVCAIQTCSQQCSGAACLALIFGPQLFCFHT
jgi:hypothetical protein